VRGGAAIPADPPCARGRGREGRVALELRDLGRSPSMALNVGGGAALAVGNKAYYSGRPGGRWGRRSGRRWIPSSGGVDGDGQGRLKEIRPRRRQPRVDGRAATVAARWASSSLERP